MSEACSIQTRRTMRADVHAENRLGVGRRLARPVRKLDPTRLATAARQHLGLDDDLAAELVGRRARLLRRRREPSVGNRDAEGRKSLLP